MLLQELITKVDFNDYGMFSEQYLFGGIDVQREKLEADGIVLNGNKVDLDRYRW